MIGLLDGCILRYTSSVTKRNIPAVFTLYRRRIQPAAERPSDPSVRAMLDAGGGRDAWRATVLFTHRDISLPLPLLLACGLLSDNTFLHLLTCIIVTS